MSTSTGVGLILVGILLYVLGVVIPAGILVTLGIVVGVVGLVVLIYTLVTASRGRNKSVL